MSKHSKRIEDLFCQACATQPVKSSRIVAAIYSKNYIISKGFNSYKTHPFQKRYSKNVHAIHLHAEISAIVNALKAGWTIEELQGMTMYVVRAKLNENKDFVQGLAKPCVGCTRCLADFGLQVIYTTDANWEWL